MGSCMEEHTLAPKLDKEEEARQVATLLVVIEKEANKVFCMFTFSSPYDAKEIESILRKFKEYCIPRENTIYERFLFFTRDQHESETIDHYLTKLCQITANCDFGSITLDRLVTGTRKFAKREEVDP